MSDINLNIEDDMTRAKRGLIWLRLDESLHGTGCPVCFEIERTEKHYLEGMLYEYVLDAGVRKKLHRQHGLCTRHARLALAAEITLGSDGLHLATMFESVIEENLKLFENQAKLLEEIAAETNKRKRKRPSRSVEADKCFVCDFVKESEGIALHGLQYFSDDDEFIENYTKSKTLICFRHLQMLIKEKVTPRVIHVSIEKIKKLKNNLSNFMKKHDYQLNHDYTQAELDSYLDVVRFFSGEMRL
jgi:hypothetical protein